METKFVRLGDSGMRIKWLDILKGLLIILVILGHSNMNYSIVKIIYSFHMPLFFMISGYLLDINKIESLMEWIKSKWKKYLLPYACFLCLNSLLNFSNRGGENVLKDILKGMYGGSVANGVYWFITNLFFGIIIYLFVEKKIEKNKTLFYCFLMILSTCVSGILIVPRSNIGMILTKLPWGIVNIPMVMFYLKLGAHLKSNKMNCLNKKNVFIIAALVSIICSVYLLIKYPGHVLAVDMKYSIYSNILINILMPISSWIVLKAFSEMLSQLIYINRLLEYIGQSTIIIMYTHLFINNMYINKFGQTYNTWCYVICAISVGCVFNYIINKNKVLSYLFLGKCK